MTAKLGRKIDTVSTPQGKIAIYLKDQKFSFEFADQIHTNSDMSLLVKEARELLLESAKERVWTPVIELTWERAGVPFIVADRMWVCQMPGGWRSVAWDELQEERYRHSTEIEDVVLPSAEYNKSHWHGDRDKLWRVLLPYDEVIWARVAPLKHIEDALEQAFRAAFQADDYDLKAIGDLLVKIAKVAPYTPPPEKEG